MFVINVNKKLINKPVFIKFYFNRKILKFVNNHLKFDKIVAIILVRKISKAI